MVLFVDDTITARSTRLIVNTMVVVYVTLMNQCLAPTKLTWPLPNPSYGHETVDSLAVPRTLSGTKRLSEGEWILNLVIPLHLVNLRQKRVAKQTGDYLLRSESVRLTILIVCDSTMRQRTIF